MTMHITISNASLRDDNITLGAQIIPGLLFAFCALFRQIFVDRLFVVDRCAKAFSDLWPRCAP